MPELAPRASSIAASVTLKVTSRAKAMIKEGVDVVNFGAGEPDFPTPQIVSDAAKKAIDKGLTRYTPATGIPELKQAVARKLKADNGLEYEPGHIVVSCGAKHSLFNVIMSVVGEGDEVIIPAPYWVSYPEMVKYAGGKPVFVASSREDGFIISPEAVKAAVGPKTKVIIINSPSNPTGAVYPPEVLEEIAGIAVEVGIWCISDEIYEKLTYDGLKHVSIASFPGMRDLSVVVNGHSKAYAMTGWRLGYIACADKALVEAVSNLQSQSTSNPNTPTQYAGLKALEAANKAAEEMRAAFEKRRDLVVSLLNDVPGVECPKPGGAFYVFPDVGAHYGRSIAGIEVNDSLSFAEAALEKAKVAIVPGGAFGNDRCVRISYACSEKDIERGVGRLREMLA